MQRDLSAYPGVITGPVGGDEAVVRYQLGQPVACGHRAGIPVSALRICASARLIVEATANGGLKAARVFNKAMAALDKAVRLV